MRPAIKKILGLGCAMPGAPNVALAVRANESIKREEYSLARLIESSSLGAGYDQFLSYQSAENSIFKI
jgi:hypothetical protein